jgi:cation diffusion facilitator family transporter
MRKGCEVKTNQAYEQGAVGAKVSVYVNLLLTILKYIAGILGNSSAMIADASHSASDIIASSAVWIGMKVGAKPADSEHPWGHGKAEPIAAKMVAIILILAGLYLGIEAVIHISEADYKVVKPIAMWAAVMSIVVKEWNFQYVWRMGKRLDSLSLKADAWHHRSDAISSVAALIGIAITIYGGPKWHFMDHLAAATVAGMIVWVGISYFKKATSALMDTNIDDGELRTIREYLYSTPGVEGVEVLNARKSGLGILVDVHIEVDPQITVLKSHEIASRARDDLIAKFPQIEKVLVHIEPYFPNDH